MNVKPTDMAIVVRPNGDGGLGLQNLLSKFCEVVAEAPRRSFKLPDGSLHIGCKPKFWVVKFANPIDAPAGVRRAEFTVKTRYACLPDYVLRPIRDPGEDATDEMVLRVGKPVANPEGVPA